MTKVVTSRPSDYLNEKAQRGFVVFKREGANREVLCGLRHAFGDSFK